MSNTHTFINTVMEAEALGIPAYALAKYDPASKQGDGEYAPGIEEYREAIIMVNNVIGMVIFLCALPRVCALFFVRMYNHNYGQQRNRYGELPLCVSACKRIHFCLYL